MLTSSTGLISQRDLTDKNTEVLEVLNVLRGCLDRLDALGAQVPAVHLETCLYELSRSFISEEITSEGE
jgi:hypothetical protein